MKRLLLVLLLAVSLGGCNVLPAWLGGPTPTPFIVTVVVAARDIALGSQITADDLTTRTIRFANKPTDAFAEPSYLVGTIPRANVKKGQIITSSMLSHG